MKKTFPSKFLPIPVNKVIKQLVSSNDDMKNTNASVYLTTGVIGRKTIPDFDDCIPFFKMLYGDNEEEYKAQYEWWMSQDGNKERGILGLFQDLCIDYALDIPAYKGFINDVSVIEETVLKQLEQQKKIEELLNGLGDIVNNIDKSFNNLVATEEKTSDEEASDTEASDTEAVETVENEETTD